jgi:hypothetical protein
LLFLLVWQVYMRHNGTLSRLIKVPFGTRPGAAGATVLRPSQTRASPKLRRLGATRCVVTPSSTGAAAEAMVAALVEEVSDVSRVRFG